MASHLPEGWYTILRILNNNNSFEPVCMEEHWITSDSELFDIIDTKRGRTTLDTPVMQTSASKSPPTAAQSAD
ncbi:hypothetical protein B2M27_15620 (plasmid) [Kluyvera intermedia]|uniref:Uncharacterized protein n=1 Tax=Kluyvera intermedia TaxID=61648 RepID=A0ABX3UDK9_KLUIN|nr:hypothetical protein [Kluyvera intermedia]ORJ49432.1 hypothetical protein B2M27_15620 [Kluyvera intermedia]